ncbi:hypothetical protein CKN82_07010 [Carnobacterium divergens]|uniref:superinfection immunity protein n=1 Tax=Carnobacterium divergens TaxID=2748 RepID=UPI001071B2C7|nr:superinfection immunity protein [Carnobacterium divergens]MDT1995185.1 superinfection immunity protein [Carnobacterium divergens]TFI68783.1 hypothetical protein CKN70_07060 [Carnobacterium divergens]TFI81255.1 hypothetical protein CKN68_07020 [Carnobacterium divergens]TFI88747.1 hypothetical protein CKN72_06890 [Carnobacterium divergens]TFI90118.1 hypothetical protein CKN61_07425 [Carnobacterium divergens]
MGILMFLGIFVYFLPTLIATRGYQNVFLVFMVNLLLGWTVIGWVVALILAYGTNTKKYEDKIFKENEEKNEALKRKRYIKGLSEEETLTYSDESRVMEMKRKAEEYKLKARIREEVEEDFKKNKLRKQFEDKLNGE